MIQSRVLTVTIFLAAAFFASAQQRVGAVDARTTANADATRQGPAATPSLPAATPSMSDANYVLGPGDQVSIIVPDLDEQFTTDKNFRVDGGGDISLPFAGQIHAAGLTTPALAKEIEAALTGKILNHPQVVVSVTEFHSQPVSIFGEVNAPGLHQVQGEKNLFDALSLAGGFTENLGSTITITRDMKWGPIPLANAHNDSTGQFSVASLSVKDVVKASDPAENIAVMPDDVITVSRSEVVYAIGSVNKPGGFELGQNESLTSLQVLALAEGLTKTAATDRAMILRVQPGSKTRTQIPVNVKQLMAGTGKDMPLQADDILFIPNSKMKSATFRTLDAVIQAATGAAIYGSRY